MQKRFRRFGRQMRKNHAKPRGSIQHSRDGLTRGNEVNAGQNVADLRHPAAANAGKIHRFIKRRTVARKQLLVRFLLLLRKRSLHRAVLLAERRLGEKKMHIGHRAHPALHAPPEIGASLRQKENVAG